METEPKFDRVVAVTAIADLEASLDGNALAMAAPAFEAAVRPDGHWYTPKGIRLVAYRETVASPRSRTWEGHRVLDWEADYLVGTLTNVAGAPNA